MIQNDATFSIKRFIKDLCDLGAVFELYFALRRVKYYGEIDYARNLYYEGRLCDSLAFLERYRQYEDDEEYKSHILENYNNHILQVIDMFPEFRIRLKLDNKTSKVMYGADIQSVFDICWYTFSRMVADVAPPVDDDLRYYDRKPPYSPALSVVNTLSDIRSVNYIAILGIAKPSVIAGTDEQAMLVKRL